MPPQLVSLNPKLSAKPVLKPKTSVESNPAYSDKTSFPTIARKDDWSVKRRSESESVASERASEPSPKYGRRAPTDRHRTHRGHSASYTAGRTRLPRVSRAFESKFHTLERNQKNLVQQTRIGGQLEYLSVSQGSSGQLWITEEDSGKLFVKIPFESPEFCFECALDLEDTFDILQVIKLRPPESMERIEEMVRVYLDRERVARMWG